MPESIDWSKLTIAKVNESEISVSDLLEHLRHTFSWSLMESLLAKALIYEEIDSRDISISDEELEAAVEDFRTERSLLTAKATESWLEENGMDSEDLYDLCELELLTKKLKEELFDEDYVRGQFALNKAEFQAIETYQISIKNEEKALEIAALIKDGESFFELAKIHSEDENQKLCGYSGIQIRSQMRPEVESILFSKQKGDIVGPLKSLGQHLIIYVEDFHSRELDHDIKSSIRSHSFEKWVSRKLASLDTELYV